MRLPVALCATVALAPAVAAAEPAVTAFHAQARPDAVYFRVAFAAPPHVAAARLVPQDDATRVVVREQGLTFLGKWSPTADTATFRLLYTAREPKGQPVRVELPVTLRRADAATDRGKDMDLARAWAQAQLAEFAALQKEAPEAAFYGFARVLLARKYGLPEPTDLTADTTESGHRQIFETHTGGAAVAESLQLRRLLKRDADAGGDRYVAVGSIAGIDVPGHPWEKMMAGQTPAAEPLAGLVPHDNYYVRFRDAKSLLDFGELLELWGANLIHAFEFQSRDAFVRDRYERQLCLPSRRLALAVRSEWIQNIAVTGSDPYLVDGTDVTVIFHLTDPAKFLAAHDTFIRENSQRFRDRWQAQLRTHRGVRIEGCTTPRREVSLYRAAVGEYVICSNSLPALQRVLDAHSGAAPSLVQSLDFRYMRTVFRADDPTENGFAFLPDAFIRRLMGPADKIKQHRRAVALGRLSMVHSAALLAGWDTGKIPADGPALLTDTGLAASDLQLPEGPAVAWDGKAGQAYSAAYNTLQFATPLIELPIDRVTWAERQEYERYRNDYARLWNQFFDPVGLRFRSDAKRVQVEAYILPLLQSDRYRMMRDLCGGEPYPFDASHTPANTLMQLKLKLKVSADEAACMTIRLEDDPAFPKRMELLVRPDRDKAADAELERAFWRLPLIVGIVGAGNHIESLREILRSHFTDRKPVASFYKDVQILRYDLDATDFRGKLQQLKALVKAVGSDGATISQLFDFLPDNEMPASLFQATVGDGYYLSLREDCLKRQIDHEAERQKALAAGKKFEPMPANTSLFIAPAARESGEAIRQYLEWQTHRRALAGTAMWLPLHRSGAIPRNADEADERAAALRWYGYEPISPDGAGYRYDRRLGEVVNTRHGSAAEPTRHPTLSANAPVRRLMERFAAMRTDLQFREDGIHTTVTFER